MSRVLIVSLLIGCSLAGCVTPPDRTAGRVVIADDHGYVDVRFDDRDRRLIRDYYHQQYRSLPPGLAKQGKVPPGHAKKLALHQPLPPGLEYRHLPDELEHRLGRLPSDYVRVIIGQDVLLMNRETRIVLDIIRDLD